MLDRAKDWADIDEMAAVGALDIPRAAAWVERIAGTDGSAARRLASLAG